jgi:RNA polymerase sigma factor (sigma-70 family)
MKSNRPNAQVRPEFAEAAKAAYPVLAKAAQVLLEERADAEDAVQEALLRACRAYGEFRWNSSATTWMYTILTRVAADFRRRRGTEALGETGASIPAQEPGPEAEAELRDESDRLLARLRTLPHRQREIVTLFYLEGLSYQGTAEALGISVGTVKSALSRARAALREELGEDAERSVDCELP